MKCGVGDYSCNLAKSLVAYANVQVGVLTTASDWNGHGADALHIFPVMKKWSLSEAVKVMQTIRSWSPDIVHIQYPTQGYRNRLLQWFLPMISFLMKKKVVQTWHEAYSRRYVPGFLLKALTPGRVVVVRPQYKNNLLPILRRAVREKEFVFIKNASVFPKINLDDQEKDVLRKRFLKEQKRLVVFFGFVAPYKGVELLFEIADPATDHIVIAGKLDERTDCYRKIMARTSTQSWLGKVSITGFLPAEDIATRLAVADAVILPFRVGGGEWNTSIHGAVLQGSFVITTSLAQNGYDKKHNVYYSRVDDVQEMKAALDRYAGSRRAYDRDIDRDEWQDIAIDHHSLYEALLSEK
jgi:glycosyltransferase involved in cell wall biosynthesis